MSEWGRATYGDPCRECGFSWSLSRSDAVEYVSQIPDAYSELLAGTDGSARHPDLSWSAVMYVCHVSDNFAIWGERLAGAALGGTPEVVSYDPDLLAKARRYDQVSVQAALWLLRRDVDTWVEAVALAAAAGVVLHHPDRGAQSVDDVVRTNTHNAWHHRWDIERSLG